MKLIKGSRSLRRYVVEGTLTGDWIGRTTECLQENAFQRPLSSLESEEKIGWTTGDSLLDTDFSVVPKWYVQPYIFAMMRIDKKTLPSNLFRARFNALVKEWLSAHSAERIPKREKDDIKDVLTAEMMAQTLPKVKTVEFCWNVEQNYLVLLNTSETINEKFCALFYQTFGLSLRPFSPLMFLQKEDPRVKQLINCQLSNVTHMPIEVPDEQ